MDEFDVPCVRPLNACLKEFVISSFSSRPKGTMVCRSNAKSLIDVRSVCDAVAHIVHRERAQTNSSWMYMPRSRVASSSPLYSFSWINAMDVHPALALVEGVLQSLIR